MQAFEEFARFLLAATFTFSAVSKVLTFAAFAGSLHAYLVPARLRRIAAGIVILSEAAVATMLAVDEQAAIIGLIGAIALLLMFSVALLKNLISHTGSSCFCFGHSARPISWADVGRNGGLMLLALAGLAGIIEEHNALGSSFPLGLVANSPGLPLVGVVLGVALALAWSRLGSVVELFMADIVELFRAD